MRALQQRCADFARQEGGAGTAMAILTLVLMLTLVALAVDVANLYRYRAMLQLTADSAAHAGMVALARTGEVSRAEAAARAMVEQNLPEALNGRLVAAGDIRVVFHDAETGRVLALQGGLVPGERVETEVANAVVVRLQRSGATGNPLPTLMLRALGQADWTLAAASVATVEPTRRCDGRQAMVAQGGITLGTGVALDEGLCLHTQGDIALDAAVDIGPDPALSLPDAARCTGPCPEVETGTLAEANLILSDVPAHVQGLAQSLLDPSSRMGAQSAAQIGVQIEAGAGPAANVVAEFFAARPLAKDLEPLREVGIDTDALETGSVVRLSALQFSSLRDRPAGLIYGVMCTGRETSDAERTIDFMGQPNVASLHGAILVTNCRITMDPLTVIEGAAVIVLHPGPLQLEAHPGARIGAPPGQCDAARHATLMTSGAIALDGSLSLGDVTLVAGGDIAFLPPPPATAEAPEARVLAGLSDPFAAPFVDPLAEMAPFIDPEAAKAAAGWKTITFAEPVDASDPARVAPARKRVVQQGLTLFAGGRIMAEGEHLFTACPGTAATTLLAPALRRIAHVMPELGDLLAPVPQPRDPAALPGTPAGTLQGAAPQNGA